MMNHGRPGAGLARNPVATEREGQEFQRKGTKSQRRTADITPLMRRQNPLGRFNSGCKGVLIPAPLHLCAFALEILAACEETKR
jgi:hypothetical protein